MRSGAMFALVSTGLSLKKKSTDSAFLLFAMLLAGEALQDNEDAPGSKASLEPAELAQLSHLHPSLYAWTLACCGRNPDDASEVLQRSYEKILRGKARFDRKATLKTWLCGVIRRTAQEYRRTEWLRMIKNAVWSLEERPSAPSPDRLWIERERADRLVSALASLPQRQKEILHLVFQQDMSIAEAAIVMNVSIGTARVHYERGKSNLAQRLEQDGHDG